MNGKFHSFDIYLIDCLTGIHGKQLVTASQDHGADQPLGESSRAHQTRSGYSVIRMI